MARPKRHWPMVEASRAEAALAVRLYNDPAEARSLEGFVVHMHLAWLYLLHAELTMAGTDYRYRRRDNPRLLERVDGEARRWELQRCVKEKWPAPGDPVRANIEYFIALRNKIEHRYAASQAALLCLVGGKTQALLLNYESELSTQFGTAASMATKLRFPVFVGSFTSEGEQALLQLQKSLPAPLRTFLAEFDAGLDESVTRDARYDFRLRVVQELAQRGSDALPLRYTRLEDLTEEQRRVVEEMGRTGHVIVRERVRNVVGADELSPKEACEAVEARVPFRFTSHDFQLAWKKLEVRPGTGAENPERTLEQYCTYHKLHDGYGYTIAYVNKLVSLCGTAEGYEKFMGRSTREKLVKDTSA